MALTPLDTQLSSRVSISKYRELKQARSKDEIIRFIRERFTERYIAPLEGKNGQNTTKHGFCTMAICCLMIEALESFWSGWPNTRYKSKCAFRSFFNRNDIRFNDFRDCADEFYTHVRCGILHQAETTGGWHIRRKGDLFTPSTKTINATKFHKRLKESLEAYCSELNEAEWDDDIWEN
ncbi:MAG: hypothetical protein HC895_05505 [Leptolyngbyaceae cyanobacterium SM1_3_5]|nr:hypothetical protein [Leptolyngbyaceae cyanobacterium SM1_3_5]